MSAYKSSVKKSSSIIGALVLVPPIILTVVLMIMPAGCGSSSSSPTPVPTQGSIQIGFTDSPSIGFQNILLNVVSVRLNPSTDPNVLGNDPNWVTITAPAGLGAVGELQIDLNQLQGVAKLFNTAIVPAQTYNQLEVLVDGNTPGSIVPTCSQAPNPNTEGCITYGMSFSTGSTLHADLTNTTPIRVTSEGLTPVVIDFNVFNPNTPIIPPSVPGGVYSITPVISVVPPSGYLAAVNGTVTGSVKSGLLINAELAGTNTVIETAAVVTTGCNGADGCFNLSLPAAPAAAGGTAYDIFMSGGSANFNALSDVVLTSNSTYRPNLTIFGNTNNGSLGGLINNAQFQSPIQSATVKLLVPSTNDSNTNVVVVSTATDPTGFFSFTVPTGNQYVLNVQQTGFDPVTSGPIQVAANKSTTCPNSLVTNSCNFDLTNTTLTGVVSVDVAPTHDLQVMVVAEESGTANLENLTLATIPHGVTQASFSIIVPTSVPLFDLVASAQDSFEGGSAGPNTGHSIAVLSQVAPGPSVTLGPLDCLGHGSLGGLVSSPDSTTTVLLLQDDTSKNPSVPVVVGQSSVGIAGSQNSGQFSFCAPPNESVTYLVQRSENGSPIGTPTGVPLMNTPLPAPSATPCPICVNSQGFCPGNCVNTALGFSLPAQ